MADSLVAAYYDRLTRWNRLARAVGYGGGSATLTVHRGLADPRANGRPTSTRLHDLIVETVAVDRSPRVLDAGCGLGGTMLALRERWGGDYTGVTLSGAQASIAGSAIAAAGRARDVRVRVGSYDNPPDGPFDVVMAIESLVHSADPAKSVRALVAQLAPGGRFVVVDDMPSRDADRVRDVETFRRGWACATLWPRDRYLDLFAQLGCVVVADRDLTEACRPRSLTRIRLLERLNHAARGLIAHRGFRAVLESHAGGLALERLYRTGLMRYRLLVIQKGLGIRD
jgi:SAM-dependent methyltransferase